MAVYKVKPFLGDGGSGGSTNIKAGSGIVIDKDLTDDSDVIMVDQEVVAYKEDIPVANPELVGGEPTLNSIQFGADKYKVGGSSSNIGGLYPNTILSDLLTKLEAPEGFTDGTIAYITVQNLRELLEEKMDLSETYAFKNNDGSYDCYSIAINLVTSFYDYTSEQTQGNIHSEIVLIPDYDSEGGVYLTILVNNGDIDIFRQEYPLGTASNNITWDQAFDTLDPTERINVSIMDSENYHAFIEEYNAWVASISPFFTVLSCMDYYSQTQLGFKTYMLDLEKFIDTIERVEEE